MKTFTKIILAAGAGYALRAYAEKDVQVTEEAFKRSSDNQKAVSGVFGKMRSRINDKIYTWTYNKVSDFLYPVENRRPVQHGPTRYAPSYSTSSRYSRFGRNSR